MSEEPHVLGPQMEIAEAMRNVRTKRQLAALFRYLGIRPKKGLGQNFLVDHNLLDFLVRTAEVGPEDLALDIGCGTGLLTAHLADAAGKVIGIEVDRALLAICSRYLEGRSNVELLRGDALASKHELAPPLVEAVEREWASGRYRALRVVANLPYSVATLIVPNLLESDLPIAAIVLTLQKEVADRMAARPGASDYGSLSLIVQAHAAVELVRRVPAAVFWPRPKVESAIVRLVPEPERRAAIQDYETFARVVRGGFTHRRKTLANALSGSGVAGQGTTPGAVLARCGIEPGARAEHVGLEQYIKLANALTSGAGQEEK